jgi:NAD+ kinase
MVRAIGISAKITSEEALRYAASVVRDLRLRGYDVCLDFATADKLNDRETKCAAKGELGKHADLLITFGGDGTLLSVARQAPKDVPILGVNMGTLGFLTEVRVEDFPAILERVLAGDYVAESRVAFEVHVEAPGFRRVFRVLNDATINKSALARIIEMRVTVSGFFVSTFRADGMIVATPTGSTAYNLSAGGPIVYPTMGAIIVTPICPHMLTNRPIVLPDDLDVEIGLVGTNSSQEIFLTLDGQEGLPIDPTHRVCVKKSPDTVRLVQSPHKNYFDVLRDKLKWGEA